MTAMEPSLALSACETALRELMTFAYTEAYGAGWVTRVAAETKRQSWQERADVEQKSRGAKGVAAVPATGLSYANFYDLVAIADKHWEPLAAALGRRAKVLPLLERMDDLRNSIGHSRPLLAFERDLMSGIAGQIRNQVTIHMSAQDDAGDIYPRIESITDSFGRRIRASVAEGEIAGAVRSADITLHPGDVVTFDCVGVDPQDRELSWQIPGQTPMQGPSGSALQLSYRVTDEDVTESFTIEILMNTRYSRYHRYRHFDHRAYFKYRVRPPEPRDVR